MLSANAQSPIAIECFMEDIDVRGMMERDLFLETAAPLLTKLDALLAEAFADCGLAKEASR